MSSHVGLVMVWKNIHFAHQNSISFCASTINHASLHGVAVACPSAVVSQASAFGRRGHSSFATASANVKLNWATSSAQACCTRSRVASSNASTRRKCPPCCAAYAWGDVSSATAFAEPNRAFEHELRQCRGIAAGLTHSNVEMLSRLQTCAKSRWRLEVRPTKSAINVPLQ